MEVATVVLDYLTST